MEKAKPLLMEMGLKVDTDAMLDFLNSRESYALFDPELFSSFQLLYKGKTYSFHSVDGTPLDLDIAIPMMERGEIPSLPEEK
jgi:hypothetical protein